MTIKLKTFAALMVTMMAALSGCKDDAQLVQQKYPYIVATNVTDVSSSGAVFNGEVGLPGTSTVTEYGFEWTNQSPPGLAKWYRLSLGNKVKDKFSARISSDLWNGKNYSVRTYALTPDNVVYSSPILFKSFGSMPPEITSISPTHGVGNSEITIVGKNFGHGNPLLEKTLSLGYYHFMTIVSYSDTLIVAKVPPPVSMPKGVYNIQMGLGQVYVLNNVSFTLE